MGWKKYRFCFQVSKNKKNTTADKKRVRTVLVYPGIANVRGGSAAEGWVTRGDRLVTSVPDDYLLSHLVSYRYHRTSIIDRHLPVFDAGIQGASLRGRHTTPPATLAQEGKIVWSEQRKVQTGDLKMPRAPAPCSRKTTHRRHTHVLRSMNIPRMYAPGILYSRYIYIIYTSKHIYMSVSKLVTIQSVLFR